MVPLWAAMAPCRASPTPGTNYVSCVGTGVSSSGVINGDYVTGDGVFLLLPRTPSTSRPSPTAPRTRLPSASRFTATVWLALSPARPTWTPRVHGDRYLGQHADDAGHLRSRPPPIPASAATAGSTAAISSTAYNHCDPAQLATFDCLNSCQQLRPENRPQPDTPAASTSCLCDGTVHFISNSDTLANLAGAGHASRRRSARRILWRSRSATRLDFAVILSR